MAQRRKSASGFRRAVGLTLPQTLVTAVDASLREKESRSSLVELLLRAELERRNVVIEPDPEQS